LAALLHGKLQIGPRSGALIRYASGVGLAAGYFDGIDGHEVFGFSWIAICAAGLLTNAFDARAAADARAGADAPASVGAPVRQSQYLPARALCWLGRHSYELYLFHIILLAGMRDIVPRARMSYGAKLPLFALFLALSCLLAGVVARYFADPLNDRLRRYTFGFGVQR
jgi:peptidoglycan/LPS O-acetylase OafA/YrhL